MRKCGAVRVSSETSAPRRRQVRGFWVVTCRDSLIMRFEAPKGVWWLVTAEPSLVQLVLSALSSAFRKRVRLSLQICHFVITGSCYFREEHLPVRNVLHRSAGDARVAGGRDTRPLTNARCTPGPD